MCEHGTQGYVVTRVDGCDCDLIELGDALRFGWWCDGDVNTCPHGSTVTVATVVGAEDLRVASVCLSAEHLAAAVAARLATAASQAPCVVAGGVSADEIATLEREIIGYEQWLEALDGAGDETGRIATERRELARDIQPLRSLLAKLKGADNAPNHSSGD